MELADRRLRSTSLNLIMGMVLILKVETDSTVLPEHYYFYVVKQTNTINRKSGLHVHIVFREQLVDDVSYGL